MQFHQIVFAVSSLFFSSIALAFGLEASGAASIDAIPNDPVSSDLVSTEKPSGQFIQQRAFDPIKLQTGLPEPAGRLQSDSELQIALLHNNVFMGGIAIESNEQLILDGESSQLSLRLSRRINNCWQVNVAGVYLAHSKGWFDQPVDDWHQFFGLPDAQRGEWPTNQLEYGYNKDDELQTLTDQGNGFGDVQLQLQRSFGCLAQSGLFRVGLKLPVGDSKRFFGSGSADLFVDAQSRWHSFPRNSRWAWSGSFGLLLAGKNELLAEQRPVSAFGVAGFNATLHKKLSLVGQIDWHSAMFNSQLTELGHPGAQLTLGLRYRVGRGAVEMSFAEDVAIDTAPDIVVRLGWVSRFGAPDTGPQRY